MLNNTKISLILATLMLLLPISNAQAMQTVFNVPSADVTPKGRLFVEQESQFTPWAPSANWLGTSYTAVGVGHNTEIDATLYNVSAPASNNIVLGTGFKSAIPIPGLDKKYPAREYKFTVGDEVLTSLQSQGVGNWAYAHLSGRVPVTNTRLTSGISTGTRQLFGENKVCFIGAVEQPVTKKLTLLTDWYSGSNNAQGFLIAGASYALPKESTVFVGYQIPNNANNGKSGFVLELAKTF